MPKFATFLKGKIRSQATGLSKILSRKGLYEFLASEYAKIRTGECVLTIGAGGGVNDLLSRFAQQQNFSVVSFDVDHKRGPDIIGDICFYDFGDQKFDVVVISEVLEHVHSPHLAIDNIHRVLTTGGRLILTVPFIFPIHDRPYDYYRYTRYGLEFLLKNFREVQICERNSWAEAINVLAPRLIRDEQKIARLFAPFFVFWAFLKLPLVFLLGRIIQTDFITSGYVATAEK